MIRYLGLSLRTAFAEILELFEWCVDSAAGRATTWRCRVHVGESADLVLHNLFA